MDLRSKVLKHIQAYKEIGEVPPPFRATIKECKDEFHMLKNSVVFPRQETQWDEMKMYLGVDIEIVVKID